MSRYSLSVEFESARPRFSSGETVRGVVKVSARAACTCKALRIELYWVNDESDPREEFSALKTDIFSGPWEVGEHRFPFEITMPQGPHSYRDIFVNVNWHLRATAVIPMAVDPVREVEFLLGPGPFGDPMRYIAGDTRHNWVDKKRQGRAGAEPRAFLDYQSLVYMLLGVFMVLGALFDIFEYSALRVILGILGVALLFSSGLDLRRWLRSDAGLKELDNRGLRVEWPDGVIQPGDTIPIAIHLDNDAGIRSIKACLICFSRKKLVRIRLFSRHSGADQLWEFISEETEYVLHKIANGTERLHLEGEVELSVEAPPIYYDEERQLLWAIDLRVQMDQWGEAQRRFFLDVRPASRDRWVAEPRALPYEPVEVAPFLEDIESTHAW